MTSETIIISGGSNHKALYGDYRESTKRMVLVADCIEDKVLWLATLRRGMVGSNGLPKISDSAVTRLVESRGLRVEGVVGGLILWVHIHPQPMTDRRSSTPSMTWAPSLSQVSRHAIPRGGWDVVRPKNSSYFILSG